MKEDKDFSGIRRCPVTNEDLTYVETMWRFGICPRCGDDSNSTITHYKTVVGKWSRPSFFEQLMGKQPVFIPNGE